MKNFQNLWDGDEMKFTEDVIKSCRMCAVFLDEPACSVFNLALDEIERLQKENKELKEFVDATRPTGICEICTSNVISRYEPLQARVQELEQEHDYLDTKCAAFENDFVLLDVIEKLKKAEARIVELEEALAKIANYESMRFRLSPYEYGVLEQIVGIAEHALR